MGTKCAGFEHSRHRLLSFLLLCSFAFCCAASEQPQDDALAIVLDVLRSNDQEMQAVAIAMVKEIPGTEMTKALAKELPNLSAASQVQLLSALADRGDSAALPAVVTAAKANDTSVRTAALKALGQLGNVSNVTLLAQTAAETTGAEQKAARESLYRLRGAEVDKAILEGIPKADPKAKVELISALGERNIYAGVKTLLEAAKDPERKVRVESLKTLKVIAKPEDLPVLVALLLNLRSSSDRTEAEKTVAAVAHKIEDKNRQAQAVLAVLPSVKDVKKRSSLLSVLGRIGDNSALPSLRKELSSKEADIRTAVIRSLSGWPTPEPISDLLNIAENSDNQIHRILALRGFVRLLGIDSERAAKKTTEMYAKAMSLAPNPMEKKGVLSGLAEAKSLDAMQMAADYLKDKSLQAEAEVAVVKIAQGIYDSFPQKEKIAVSKPVKESLDKVIKITQTDSLRKQAQQLMEKFSVPARNELMQEAKKALEAADPAMGDWQGSWTLDDGTDSGPLVAQVVAQVIALGKGEYRANFLEEFDKRVASPPGLNGRLDGETVRFTGKATSDRSEYVRGKIEGGKFTGTFKESESKGSFALKKVIRLSPTLGAKPPKGAIVLFDGTNFDQWKHPNKKEGEDEVKWELTEGRAMQPKRGAGSIITRRQFTDVKLHVEFRTPFMPEARGQGRGNSGVYLQGRYEVQVLDSYGLEGKSNECGGIYGVKEPLVNMCAPPTQWQTYDITFTAPRFDSNGKMKSKPTLTVYHNGVLIHDKTEAGGATTASLGGDAAKPEGIYLQDHGNPVQYRNIWVVEL